MRRRWAPIAGRSGQSTVEMAIVLAAFLAVALGFGALWHLADSGEVVSHALESASHNISASSRAWMDVAAY